MIGRMPFSRPAGRAVSRRGRSGFFLVMPSRELPRLRHTIAGLLAACVLVSTAMPRSVRADSTPAAVLQELRSFQNMGTVLYVAAHPDDENTQMICYLARGKNYRTAYLSLTRGDGGQNVLAGDLDERLGVARTQELIAARKLDGGQQFFTRAIDFGFSKDYQETLSIWNKDEVLADIVRIIRYFQPDVIVTRFTTQPGGTHGHHTASAVLAAEAFKIAGDKNAYPEQLKTLKPWQPKRIYMNRGGGGGLQMEIGGEHPVSGTSLNELAIRSRAMHKTQGFDNFRGFGGGGGGGPRSESLNLLDGAPATNDIMEGVDTTWNRLSGGSDVATLVGQLLEKFNTNDLSANVPLLLKIRTALSNVPIDAVTSEKRRQLDRIIADCAGLTFRSQVSSAEVVPGEQFRVKHVALITSKMPVRWVSSRLSGTELLKAAADLKPGTPVEQESQITVPLTASLSHPYWLRADRALGTFRVDDLALITEPDNPPAFPLEHTFEIGGQRIVLQDEPVQLKGDVDGGDRPAQVIPPISMSFGSDVAVFVPGSTRRITVQLTAARGNLAGRVQLELPKEWKVSPQRQDFRLKEAGANHPVRFTVTAPQEMDSAKIVASATIGSTTFRHERAEVRYRHLPLQLLHPLAAIRAVNMDVQIAAKKVGYIPGAGDDIPAALRQLGCDVSVLEGEVTTNHLAGLDAVVIGVRAFNVRTNFGPTLASLAAFAEAGGTVVAQYNRANNTLPAPFGLRLSGARVTDETAEVRLLAPEHPVLNKPNRITAADFSGWVQERGLYFPNQWESRFTPILACNDPNEQSLEGGLLVAPHGKGHIVYTGLSFFRQLPAGVPGAYRLFANLVSLGK